MADAPPPEVAAGDPPPAAVEVFGPRLALAVEYAARLAGPGVARGLIGPREVPRLWDRHLLNCAVVGEAVPSGSSVADIGSGAGLPGLVLALARPDLRVTLVEPLLRRVAFLEEMVEELGLAGVAVVRSRAEDLAGSTFDITTSRAVAPLPRLAQWCLPLTRVGGSMVAMKGERAAAEIASVAPADWSRSGADAPEVLSCGVGVVEPAVTLVRVARRRSARVRLGGREGRTSPRP